MVRPNGGLIYCMKFIEDNISWLIERISKLKNKYLIFDLPGNIYLVHIPILKGIIFYQVKLSYTWQVIM